MKLFIASAVLTMFIPFCSWSQDTKFDLSRSIEFSNSKQTEEIIIKTESNSTQLYISIKSAINQGGLIVEIYDPAGEKQGNFEIESIVKSNDGKTEYVQGSIQKKINVPMAGEWKIKIIPTNTTGHIRIGTYIGIPDDKK